MISPLFSFCTIPYLVMKLLDNRNWYQNLPSGATSIVGPIKYSTVIKKDLVFPDVSDGKESVCNAGDLGSIPRSGTCPVEGNGYPLQCSCLGIPKDRAAWWTTVHVVAKSQRAWATNTMPDKERLNLFKLENIYTSTTNVSDKFQGPFSL